MNRSFDCLLQGAFVYVMAAYSATARVFGALGSGKDVLPNPLAVGIIDGMVSI